MSIETVMSRVAALNTAFASPLPPTQPTAGAAPPSPSAPAPAAGAFASALQGATMRTGAATGAPGMVAAAQGEVGQVEAPPGSNDSARIAQYRGAVPGGGVGPWCAYFASWVAQQNGTPLGDNGQGFARVDDVYAWAQRTGRAVPNASGTQPKPGDLIIWDEHMGIVESVEPDGTIRTIEGNSSDSVAQRTYGPDGGGAVGYVRMS